MKKTGLSENPRAGDVLLLFAYIRSNIQIFVTLQVFKVIHIKYLFLIIRKNWIIRKSIIFRAQVVSLKEENAFLRNRLEALLSKASKNSHNSSKPLSSGCTTTASAPPTLINMSLQCYNHPEEFEQTIS